MEKAKEHLPERNGARNPDGSNMGWAVWKFHSMLHKAMEIMMYGWSENTSTQCSESAHKVNFTHDYTWLHMITHISTCIYQCFTDKCQSRAKVLEHEGQAIVFVETTPSKAVDWTPRALSRWIQQHSRGSSGSSGIRWVRWRSPKINQEAGRRRFRMWSGNQISCLSGGSSSRWTSHAREGQNVLHIFTHEVYSLHMITHDYTCLQMLADTLTALGAGSGYG